MSVRDLCHNPAHLGSGVIASTEPDSIASPEWYGDDRACHEADGAKGRPIAMHSSDGTDYRSR